MTIRNPDNLKSYTTPAHQPTKLTDMMPDLPEPIAIIGSACRFPGSVDTPSKLWELLSKPRDVGSRLPSARFDPDSFYHVDSQHHGHANVKDFRSYFLDSGAERRFDAAFFGINPAEANVLDPQVRLLLETTYEALEEAGQTMDMLQGSDTGCYVGLSKFPFRLAAPPFEMQD